MKLSSLILSAAFLFSMGFASVFAANHSYQVTGKVESVSDSNIVVMKGKEKFEIAREPSTQVQGDVKAGNKVTVEYRMTATSIEVKGDKTSSTKASHKRTRR